MRKTIAMILAAVTALWASGCHPVPTSPPKPCPAIAVDSSGSIIFQHNISTGQDDISDVNLGSTSDNTLLVDVPSGFTYNPATPPQVLVTITTDTGATFTQSFNLAQATASSFGPATSGTQTFAFVAQNPSAVASFIQSAANQATSTADVAIQSNIGFQGPTDGGTYTVYGRHYNAYEGVQSAGSVAYTAPFVYGGPGSHCPGGRCPLQ